MYTNFLPLNIPFIHLLWFQGIPSNFHAWNCSWGHHFQDLWNPATIAACPTHYSKSNFQQWQKCWTHCTHSNGAYFEGDNPDIPAQKLHQLCSTWIMRGKYVGCCIKTTYSETWILHYLHQCWPWFYAHFYWSCQNFHTSTVIFFSNMYLCFLTQFS